ncbi:MAG: ferrous iron transporter B [Planctomycetota bacterium]
MRSDPGADPHLHVALVGQPNVGKTTLFNRLCGQRGRAANFPGSTQDARLAPLRGSERHPELAGAEVIDLPGVYSLELDSAESRLTSGLLEGSVAPVGHERASPDRLLVVADATNLPRSLALVGEAARRRLPMAVAINRTDAARKRGLAIDAEALSRRLGCPVLLTCARTGEGVEPAIDALAEARIPTDTPGPTPDALEQWADALFLTAAPATEPAQVRARRSKTDRADRVLLHPLAGPACFAAIMAGLFWSIFKLATIPMDWVDGAFGALASVVGGALPAGPVSDLLTSGVIGGVGATVIFVPQIFLLFFLLALLEDSGYLARAAFVIDRWLRPFGLPGHAFVPLLSSHACALPGIIACRAIPGRRERLAAILVAPFMSCTARIPVYVLLTTLLFRDRPALAALAFLGCYALGAAAGLLSALIARATLLRGRAAPMALELPDFRRPSSREALASAWQRSWMFLKKAGGVILAISIVLWWLSAYPNVAPPAEAEALRNQAIVSSSSGDIERLEAEADRVEARHAAAQSYAGRLGRAIQPVFAPLGYDWQLSVGVLTSFAAREVFVSTMAVVTQGSDDTEDEGVLAGLASAERTDGTALFTTATAWSLLVYYVLAMQCLPTLVVTAREAGGVKWALLQFGWMSALAYVFALVTYQALRALGVS